MDEDLKVCAVCGTKEIQFLKSYWVNANTDEFQGHGPVGDNDTWCPRCEDHTNIITESEFNELKELN